MNLKILKSLSYGVYAIGVKGEKYVSACITNTVVQVSSDPNILIVSISKDNYSNECIKKEKVFTVSVLSENTSGAVIGALGFNSGKKENKLLNINHKILKEGLPIVKENTCCWMLCKVVNSVETNSHTVFFGEIISGSDKRKGKPMTYSYYHEILKGALPKNAPGYNNNFENNEDRYVCSICGYVYKGDEIPFENLPDDWICPICGMTKSVFKIVK